MSNLISFALSQRVFILILALLLLGFGINSYKNLPIDAFPDIAPTQVRVIIKSSGMTPDEMEARVVIPIESAMLGIQNQLSMRSLAKYGICDIAIDFKDGVDIYWARAQVNERLSSIMSELPSNVEGGLAPISTPLSDILMFSIESKTLDLTQKRTILDWVITPQLRTISGVAEVNTMGGLVKTYEISPDLSKMAIYGISLEQLQTLLEQNNANTGLGQLTHGVNSLLVRSVGSLKNIDDIKNLAITTISSKPIYIKDIADVHVGHISRFGFSTKDGKGEAVQGVVIGLKGADTQIVLKDVKEKLSKIEATLPQDAKINIFYDRSLLVDLATTTVKDSLIEATILIVIVLLLLLGNFASAISVALILPFALFMSFIAMDYFHLSANLMSLGGLAIAIGMLVDSAVVMVEHITAELGKGGSSKLSIIKESAIHMAPPIITGVLIIIIVFLPLLSLEGLEGKLFRPVALSIVFALTSSLILSLTLIPVISSYILKLQPDKESWLISILHKKFIKILEQAIKHSKIVFSSVLILFIISLYLAYKTGKTFMPTMDEGTLVVMIESLPSISLDESVELNSKIQKKLLNDVADIDSIIARTGTDEIGLDPMGLNDSDTFLVLKPKSQWVEKSKEQIIEKIRKSLEGIDGIEFVFSQPIEMRISEMLSGVRGDLAINIFGEDLQTLDDIAQEIKTILLNTKGSSDVYKKSNEGIEYVELLFNKEAMSFYNLNINDVSNFVKTMLDGREVGVVQEGIRRIKLMIKGDISHSLDSLKNLTYTLNDNSTIPLQNIVTLKKTTGMVAIEHENGYRKTIVQSNVKNRDLVGFVNDVKSQIQDKIKLPVGYSIEYGGEFENQQRAATRLMFIVPVALFLIFVLLFVSFGSITKALLVLANIPLALIGGFAGLYFSGEYLSVPASVGFIALLGIAVLNGVVLVNYFNHLLDRGYSVLQTIKEGTIRRFRPVVMTATITALGLAPLLFATGVGSEVQKPLAIVVISGLISSTALTLVVLPLLFLRFYKTPTKAKL